MSGRNLVLIVAITGASGAVYGIRLLEQLHPLLDVETHLVISDAGRRTIELETDWKVADVQSLATHCYEIGDIAAALSSGSFRRDGMVVVPCSMKTLSALASSYADNLITRAGDVTIKERKPLVLVFRETPLHIGHLHNLSKLAEMGAILLPPMPAFYHRPRTIDDLVNHTVGRIMDIFGLELSLFEPWKGADQALPSLSYKKSIDR